MVVTPQVGAADIVRESGAGLVLDGEPGALAAGIGALVSDAAARARMARNGADFVRRRYAWDTIAAQMEEAYAAAMGGRSARSSA